MTWYSPVWIQQWKLPGRQWHQQRWGHPLSSCHMCSEDLLLPEPIWKDSANKNANALSCKKKTKKQTHLSALYWPGFFSTKTTNELLSPIQLLSTQIHLEFKLRLLIRFLLKCFLKRSQTVLNLLQLSSLLLQQRHGGSERLFCLREVCFLWSYSLKP